MKLTPNQKVIAAHIEANPGQSLEQIAAATGLNAVKRSLTALANKRIAHDDNGWFITESKPAAAEPAADDSFPHAPDDSEIKVLPIEVEQRMANNPKDAAAIRAEYIASQHKPVTENKPAPASKPKQLGKTLKKLIVEVQDTVTSDAPAAARNNPHKPAPASDSGVNVLPIKIEQLMRNHPEAADAIRQAYVIGQKNAKPTPVPAPQAPMQAAAKAAAPAPVKVSKPVPSVRTEIVEEHAAAIQTAYDKAKATHEAEDAATPTECEKTQDAFNKVYRLVHNAINDRKMRKQELIALINILHAPTHPPKLHEEKHYIASCLLSPYNSEMASNRQSAAYAACL